MGRTTVTCKICKNEFSVTDSLFRDREKSGKAPPTYCSKKCANLGKTTGGAWKCSECGKEIHVTEYWRKRYRQHFCSRECYFRCRFRGSSKSWEGFVESTAEYRKMADRIRKSPAVIDWKQRVLDRDQECAGCGSTEDLHVHHIVALVHILADNDFSELGALSDDRLVELSNGVALWQLVPCRDPWTTTGPPLGN